MTQPDPSPAFWVHQLTRGPRPTPRACEEILRKRPRKMDDAERIQVTTDPDAFVRVLRTTTESLQ